jgi:prepilin-type processing-associated H-X9-DG protein
MAARLLIAWLFVLLALAPARAAGPCESIIHEDASYTVCRFDLRHDRLALYNLDPAGKPFGSITALKSALASEGKTLSFAMNAGMFDDAQKPIGLYIEAGRQQKKLNRRSGGGNFHLKPNGVVFFGGGEAGVMETEAFAKSGRKPQFASQSGPMLVIDGRIHPKFSADGPSRKIRNGVGAVDGHTLVFAISDEPVNFHAFARLFRDRLGCRNALFLDGSVSSLYARDLERDDGFYPIGPIVGLAE